MLRRRVVLIILDGFGLREEAQGNAIRAARTPFLDAALEGEAATRLATSGEAVGLPPGQMGNSEVGHMNIGAGRVLHQMLTRIDKDVREGAFFANPVLVQAAEAAKRAGGALHLLGLVSDGGVHSSQDHLHALVNLAEARGLPGDRLWIHAFTDGRDTGPTTGAGHLTRLSGHLVHRGGGVVDADAFPAAVAVHPYGRVATVSGRYHAMDRDRRWDRTRRAWDAIVHARGERGTTAVGYLAESYAKGVTDEFVPPAVVEPAYPGVRDGDSLVFFNFRPDRARQLTRAFTEPGFPEFDTGRRPAVAFATMTRYDDTFEGVPFAYGDDRPGGTLGEVVSKAGMRQLRCAETEKYAHVTYFLNGGEEKPFPGEERVLVPSPKDVPTYDRRPEMGAFGIRDVVVDALRREAFDLVVVNFANCDMVGHTGDFAATVHAVETVDRCVGDIFAAARDRGYHVLLTADHGNAEEMTNPDGSPQTAHTTLPVPLAYVGEPGRRLAPGILADVAPTVLDLLGLPKPASMTGSSRLVSDPGRNR